MDVSLLVQAFEDNTISYKVSGLCEAIGIKMADLKDELERRLQLNPPVELGNKNGQNRNCRHGYQLEKVKLIVEIMQNMEIEHASIANVTGPSDELATKPPRSEFNDDLDSEMAALDVEKIVSQSSQINSATERQF